MSTLVNLKMSFVAMVFTVFYPLAGVYAQGGMGAQKTPDKGVNPKSIGFGAQVGSVSVEDLDDMVMSFGAFADYALDKQFTVGASVDYWDETSGQISDNPVEVSNFVVGLNGRWIFTNVNAPVQPYALVGLAVHRIEVSISERVGDQREIDQFEQTYEDVEGELGSDLAAGVMYKFDNRINAQAEVRFRSLFDDKVNFDQVAYTGSLAYRL
jgi:opacity protein-like surface antigen